MSWIQLFSQLDNSFPFACVWDPHLQPLLAFAAAALITIVIGVVYEVATGVATIIFNS